MARRGHIIVVSAPSGAGKTTIARELLRRNPGLRFSISATTRPKRVGEVDGYDYFFLTREEFDRRVAQGAFVEWEEIYGNLYGTLRSEVDNALQGGVSVLFDVDVNGALSIKEQYPEAVLIFIRPPSLEVLRERLQGRRTESDAVIAQRLERVPMELERGARCDYQVVNDDLARAIDEVQTIVANHLAE